MQYRCLKVKSDGTMDVQEFATQAETLSWYAAGLNEVGVMLLWAYDLVNSTWFVGGECC